MYMYCTFCTHFMLDSVYTQYTAVAHTACTFFTHTQFVYLCVCAA